MDRHLSWCYLCYLFLYSFSFIYTISDNSYLLNFLQKKVIKRMNTIGNTTGSSNASSLIHSCINCGTRHNETACPKCGSKMKKADFHRF